MQRTLENCSVIKRAVAQGTGEPKQHPEQNKCDGYARSEDDDEPCNQCKHCRLNTFYEN